MWFLKHKRTVWYFVVSPHGSIVWTSSQTKCIWAKGENVKASDAGRSCLGGERGSSRDRQGRPPPCPSWGMYGCRPWTRHCGLCSGPWFNRSREGTRVHPQPSRSGPCSVSKERVCTLCGKTESPETACRVLQSGRLKD